MGIQVQRWTLLRAPPFCLLGEPINLWQSHSLSWPRLDRFTGSERFTRLDGSCFHGRPNSVTAETGEEVTQFPYLSTAGFVWWAGILMLATWQTRKSSHGAASFKTQYRHIYLLLYIQNLQMQLLLRQILWDVISVSPRHFLREGNRMTFKGRDIGII